MNCIFLLMYQGAPEAVSKHDRLHHAEPRHEIADTIRVAAMGIAYEEAADSYVYDQHAHDNHELILVDKGIYRCRINNGKEELNLGPGSLVLVCPGDLHTDRCEPPLSYYTVWFRLRRELVDGDAGQIRLLRGDLSQEQQVFACDPSIRILLDTMFADGRHEQRFGWPLQQAHTQTLVWRLAESLPGDVLHESFLASSAPVRLQQRLHELFVSSEGKVLSVADMAAAFGLAPSTFAHRCCELLGTSPGKLWLRYRVQRAQHLLRYGDQTVAELAQQLGFADASHFVHAFRRAVGMSPGRYRKNCVSS